MRSLIISLSVFFITFTNAQIITLEQAETQTYNSFMKNDYKTTIQIGNEAIKQGLKSYYISYRIGVSYYFIKNYEASISNLEAAKSIDSNDSSLLEYLYYSYIFTNRNEKAVKILELLPDELKVNINYKQPLFKSIEMEMGILKTNNFDNFQNNDLKNGGYFASGNFYSDVQFANVIINNLFGSKFQLKNVLSAVSNTSNNVFQFALPIASTQILTDKNNYFQWNIIGKYYLKGWHIGAGFGLYNSSYINYSPVTPSISNPLNDQFTSEKTTSTALSGSISLSKKMKYFEPNLAVSYATISDLKTISAEAGLSYFPLGNLNFYGNSKIGYVSNDTNKNTIFSQLIGVKIAKKIWFETYGAYGNHQNYVSDNGLFVFNTPNKINWYAGANLNFYFKKVDFTLGYGMQERGASYNYYSNQNPTIPITTNYTYKYNLLKTKIVWKF